MTSTGAEKKSILHWVDPKDTSGEFKRQASSFRQWISDAPGAEFPPESGRYRLYVSYACPWAHRTLITLHLKNLTPHIATTAVHWHLAEGGWRFVTAAEASAAAVPGENVHPDAEHAGATHLSTIYRETEPDYSGRYTVPVLWDAKRRVVVNNESAEIVRMLGGDLFDRLPGVKKDVHLVPSELEAKIDEANVWIYDGLNNGVYKAGFATSQAAYDRAVAGVFATLDRIEGMLKAGPGPYFFGAEVSETDVRLFTTAVRFDPVYVQHFKCNLRDIRSGYPAIHRWLRRLYWDWPAFRETTQFEHIKLHYTKSHRQINPFGITPAGPEPNILHKESEVNAAKE
jgi:glutathionyl-hydroquinone reductase